jgi:hypothetical protein
MRGLKRHTPAPILAAGHPLAQNLRRGHHDISINVPAHRQLRTILGELVLAI